MASLSVNRILETIDTTVAAWVKEKSNGTDIVQRVRTELDGALKAIIFYAVGIKKDSFANSRVNIETRSPGYVILKGKIEKVAGEWVEENLDTIQHQLTGEEIAAFKRQYAKEYDRHVQKMIGKLARNKAEQDAKLIIDRVGLTTDKMCEVLQEVITDEQKVAAAEEAARGKEFMQRTKLRSAEVRGVVAYDGKKLSDLIQEPHANCWHVVQLVSTFSDADCHILTNGKEWHPLEPVFDEAGLDCKGTEVVGNFGSARQMIFNYLDEADRLFIAQALAEHYRSKSNGDGLGDGIPF